MKERNSFNLQTYIPPTKVAQIIQGLEANDMYVPPTSSGLLRKVIDVFIANTTKGLKPVESTGEALVIISTHGLSTAQLSHSGRSANLVRQLEQENEIDGFCERDGKTREAAKMFEEPEDAHDNVVPRASGSV